ncbi:hypothetical protein RKE29_01510 [Streptomyces sp. B1866]|uniref:hypothetical protein n=1 Tax=Streptomyces sp. B1866 TaxID=3075431 RepID=UPI00288EC2FC|nr:hypothetical protein [Streptomyces sp. B1866]MDT3395337.1 hypothetical protein [Streptomyces sp. B1866]
MDTDPHIVIGRHPDLGIVAANRHRTAVIDHVLRRAGFQPAPGRDLYALTEPDRDGARRTGHAVRTLRSVGYRVAADLAFEPDTPPLARQEPRAPAQTLSGPYAPAPVLASGRFPLPPVLPPERRAQAVAVSPARAAAPGAGEAAVRTSPGHPAAVRPTAGPQPVRRAR